MYVRDILTAKGTDVFVIAPDHTIASLAKDLTAQRIGAAVVSEGGHVVGVVSERDIVRMVANKGTECVGLQVHEARTKEVVSCTSDTPIDEVMNLMTERRIRHLPVLDGAHLAGIVSIGDVVKSRIQTAEREATQLREYIQA